MKSSTLLATLFLASAAFASPSAEQLFDTKCAACHIKTFPKDKSSLIAPPVMGVMRHVKMHYADKDAAVAFISDYVMNPQRSKAVCMPQNIKRFGLMPSQKGAVTETELKQIAGWMYDNYPPQNMMSRGQSCQGGKGGMGQMGKGRSGGMGMNSNNRAGGMKPMGGQGKAGGGKGKKASPFLITKGLPHLTGMLMKSWDDPALALTPKQKERLLVVRQETLQGIKRIKPQVMRLEKEIKMMARNGAGNQKLDPMIDKLAALKAEASKIHIRCLHDTRAVLTPKQMQYLINSRQRKPQR